MTLEVRMSKELAMAKDATLSKEMMKIVRMRLMGLRMRSPPKVETVKPKVSNVWPFFYPFQGLQYPTCSYFVYEAKYSFDGAGLSAFKTFPLRHSSPF